MAASNIVIHLFALAAFIALGYALLRSQKQREFMVQLLPGPRQKLLFVEDPIVFVKKFSAAFSIPLQLESAPASRGRVVLKPEQLVKFLLQGELEQLRVSAVDGRPQVEALLRGQGWVSSPNLY